MSSSITLSVTQPPQQLDHTPSLRWHFLFCFSACAQDQLYRGESPISGQSRRDV